MRHRMTQTFRVIVLDKHAGGHEQCGRGIAWSQSVAVAAVTGGERGRKTAGKTKTLKREGVWLSASACRYLNLIYSRFVLYYALALTLLLKSLLAGSFRDQRNGRIWNLAFPSAGLTLSP
jgi:hypothetical protein